MRISRGSLLEPRALRADWSNESTLRLLGQMGWTITAKMAVSPEFTRLSQISTEAVLEEPTVKNLKTGGHGRATTVQES